MLNKIIGWEMYENIGMSIPNPRGCVHITPPENMTAQERQYWENFVEQLEIEINKEIK